VTASDSLRRVANLLRIARFARISERRDRRARWSPTLTI